MNFEACVAVILYHEGGYVNDSNDPGGETRFGISKRSFPNVNIKELTLEHAKDLYRRYYWDMCECDKLPDWARLIVFDCAVNQGVPRAVIDLQRISGSKPDGIIGPKTLERVFDMEPTDFIGEYAMKRFGRYYSNPRWKHFGGGWAKRLLDITVRSYTYLVA